MLTYVSFLIVSPLMRETVLGRGFVVELGEWVGGTPCRGGRYDKHCIIMKSLPFAYLTPGLTRLHLKYPEEDVEVVRYRQSKKKKQRYISARGLKNSQSVHAWISSPWSLPVV